MSLSKRLVQRGNHPSELVLTITVQGAHDIYRLARHLESGQCEFADLGRRTLRSLRKAMGPNRYEYMEDAMTGKRAMS